MSLQDLTVDELKEIIRSIVREELAKNWNPYQQSIPPMPVQPYYYETTPFSPKPNEVWCNLKGGLSGMENNADEIETFVEVYNDKTKSMKRIGDL